MTRALEALALGIVMALLTGILLDRPASATPPSAPDPEPSWQPVPTLTEAPQTGSPAASSAGSVGGASSPAAPSTEPTASAASMPETTPGAVAPSAAPGATRSVTGLASWYCRVGVSACTRGYPASGLYAAAGPALRVGNWRGRWVTVTANGRSVRARLSDWCACPGGRVIDLYASIVNALGLSLSRGIYTVRVSWP